MTAPRPPRAAIAANVPVPAPVPATYLSPQALQRIKQASALHRLHLKERRALRAARQTPPQPKQEA